MEARLLEETFDVVAMRARSFAGSLPIEWIEAIYNRHIRGVAKSAPMLAGLLGAKLADCLQAGRCDFYGGPAPEGTPEGYQVDMSPAAVKRRRLKESFAAEAARRRELASQRGGQQP